MERKDRVKCPEACRLLFYTQTVVHFGSDIDLHDADVNILNVPRMLRPASGHPTEGNGLEN